MHPRNIYKDKADFNSLAKLYPDFAKITQLDISGKVKIDFKNPESSRTFTKCCLKKDFDLDIELPPDKLLPTIPLRLNLLLWIEDLIKHCGISDEISGIDIGCGASCIYCLLAVRMNKNWKMFALEIDESNIKFANENISRNHLQSEITVIPQADSQKLFEQLLRSSSSPKTFCLCNPPFFSSHDDSLGENRTGKRKAPKSLNSGSPHEIIFLDGGELGFVTRILSESFELQGKIEIYSTMFGCKKNFQTFIEELKRRKLENFTTTEFVQGKTTRWGVAWSFKHDLKNFKDHHELAKTERKSFEKHVLSHEVEKPFDETEKKLKEIFEELKIQIKTIEDSAKIKRWELSASLNTWSNQRRRKRAEVRGQTQGNSIATTSQSLQAGFELRHKNKTSQIQIFFISGTMNKDCVNQILQYIKNKFK